MGGSAQATAMVGCALQGVAYGVGMRVRCLGRGDKATRERTLLAGLGAAAGGCERMQTRQKEGMQLVGSWRAGFGVGGRGQRGRGWRWRSQAVALVMRHTALH